MLTRHNNEMINLPIWRFLATADNMDLHNA